MKPYGKWLIVSGGRVTDACHISHLRMLMSYGRRVGAMAGVQCSRNWAEGFSRRIDRPEQDTHHERIGPRRSAALLGHANRVGYLQT